MVMNNISNTSLFGGKFQEKFLKETNTKQNQN